MTKEYQYEVEIVYPFESNPKLNAKLDVLAAENFGDFISMTEMKDETRRIFGFDESNNVEQFVDEAYMSISRYLKIEVIPYDKIPERMKWSAEEAVYHHLVFDESLHAERFYRMMKSCFMAYLDESMYDILLVDPNPSSFEDDSGIVVWGFPLESVILGLDFEEDVAEFTSILGGPKKKEELN